MISNNIDGSNGGASQLLELLTTVSNPKAYQEKIKALEDATAENKKYVELVGPASEIKTLRDKADALLAKAEIRLGEAEATALQTVNDAQRRAEGLLSEAKAHAAQLEAKAKALSDEAKQRAVEAQVAESVANATKAELERKMLELEVKANATEEAEKAAKEAKAVFDKAYSTIIAKHKAFIESL